MSEETIKKITAGLTKIETALSPQQSKNKKVIFLLSKKKEYEKFDNLQKEYQELISQTDNEEEKKILKSEIDELEIAKEKLINQIKSELIREENTKQNILIEIRPGTGGDEAGLFARDLYRMYYKFSQNKGWKIEMVETKVDLAGNFTFVAFLIKGREVFDWLKNEAGVHRVQRVPQTENKGRVHTSTATVAVLPEAQDVVLNVRSQDLKIETCRSSGAGGQHVNTTDSAVRITHLPTGVIATSQDGRSQHDNKERALFTLKSRLLKKLQSEKAKEVGDLRSSMIGTAERAEKIRTYNYPQNRVTDHRLGISWSKLNFIMEGEIEEICQKLIDYEAEKNLTRLITEISELKKEDHR